MASCESSHSYGVSLIELERRKRRRLNQDRVRREEHETPASRVRKDIDVQKRAATRSTSIDSSYASPQQQRRRPQDSQMEDRPAGEWIA